MTNVTRRGFLQSSAAAGAVLYIGVTPNGATAAGGSADAMLNPFVKIDSEGNVIAIVKHFEKGQGPATGLTSLIAEELGVTMDQIGYEFAPSNAALYSNTFFGGFQGTGGSTAMANSFMQYRNAGANAREMLIKAAAQAWGVDASALDIQEGTISGAGKSAPLGDFVAAAADIAPVESPRLREPSEWKIIGNPAIKRKDSPIKVNGKAEFAMDLHLPNQMVVMIKRTPQRGGQVVSFDDSGAQDVKGFIMAQKLPTGHGVAVYAESTWAAMQARSAIEVEWDMSAAEVRSSEEIKDEIMAALDVAPVYNVNKADQTAVSSAVEGAAQIVEKTFYFPLLAHAPMEPLNCTIEQTAEGKIVLHDGCQSPSGPHMALAQIFELPMEMIEINTLLAGGSFGRRATPDADYQVEAALSFIMTDRARPVKLVWDREDDIRGGYYRPAAGHKVRIGLDDAGNIMAWEHHVAGQSIMKGTAFEAMAVQDGIDHSTVEGVAGNPYTIPNMSIGLSDVEKATSVLWWRSVGHTHTAYVMEVMMDLAAKAAGQDPVEFRLAYLTGNKDQDRKANVLKLVAEKGNWGKPAAGNVQGIAVHKSFGSYVAEIVEISGNIDDGIQVEKVTAAVDCGIVVNPDVVVAQIEGGIGYGIGHAMRDQITLTAGSVEQSNFPDYEPLRISDIKAIETHIVASAEAPSGIGEPGTPPSAPALANAIAQLDVVVAELPMAENGVYFV